MDGRRVCSADGLEVVGFGASLRHAGEAIAVLVPEPEDARSVQRALEIARSVAQRMRGASHEDIAHAVTEALYAEGLLRRNRGPKRGDFTLLKDEEPREPDHAERAAGERIPA
jgi:hypothetical protein